MLTLGQCIILLAFITIAAACANPSVITHCKVQIFGGEWPCRQMGIGPDHFSHLVFCDAQGTRYVYLGWNL